MNVKKLLKNKKLLAVEIILLILLLILIIALVMNLKKEGGRSENAPSAEASISSNNTLDETTKLANVDTTNSEESVNNDETTSSQIDSETAEQTTSNVDDNENTESSTSKEQLNETTLPTVQEETTTKGSVTQEETTTSSAQENDKVTEDEIISIFTHAGVLYTEESFEYMQYAIDNNISPNIDTWNTLLVSPYSNATWNPRPLETVVRGGNGDNVAQLYIDVARAYQCALIWRISGSEEHGDAACRILNAWSSTLKTVTGNADRYLAAGLFGYQLANISEMMREHPDFEVEQMQEMLYTVFYKPLNERFLVGNEYGYPHNDAYFQNYWANWDLCNMASAMAIGIFGEKEDAYNLAVDYFINGIGNGSIYNAIPYVYEDGTAQWQESGRDQGHTNLGIGLMACICEMAWNQGDDLYGFADNRFLKAAEYVAKYNNGEEVQFTEYEWGSGRNGTLQYHTVISGAGRGEVRPVWWMIYNHYVNRKGLEAPNIEKRLEGVNWLEYGAVSGGHATTFDQPGWGSLTYAGNTGNMQAESPKGTVEEGKYRIVSVQTGKSLKACDDNIVRQCVKGSDDRDVWELISKGDGEFKVKNVETGLYMAVDVDSYANAAWIIVSNEEDKASQRFAFLATDVGNYRIVASNSGKTLDIPWGSDDETLNIQQYRYNQYNFQKWYLEKVE